MTINEATEQAYKNGYEKGYDDGYRYGKNRAMEDIAFPKFLVRLPEPSKEELEDLLKSPVIIHKSREEIIPLYHNGWIPVTERLPEVVDTYLVVVKCKYDWEKEYEIATDVATYNPYEKAYIDDCWNTYIDWDEGQQYIHVTHWMPLPEPPKEVE